MKPKFYAPNIESIWIGDLVGRVDGPGQNPRNSVWKVISIESTRFGNRLWVEDEQGHPETVHSFSSIGIGWYWLGTPVGEVPHDVKVASCDGEDYFVYFGGEVIGQIVNLDVFHELRDSRGKALLRGSLEEMIESAQATTWTSELEAV